MTDNDIINLIRSGDRSCLNYVYRKYYKMIINSITKNSGSVEDGKDIYQEGLICLWIKISNPDFQLTSKISTYLYAICQNLWKNELNRKAKFIHQIDDIIDNIEVDSDEDKINIIMDSISELNYDSQKLIEYYYFDGLSTSEIAVKMGYSNANVVKSRKYKIMKILSNKLIKH